MYLHARQKISDSDTFEIIRLFRNKILQKDLIYFIQLNIIKINDNFIEKIL